MDRELCQGREARLHGDGRERWVDSGREVVECDFLDVRGNARRTPVRIGKRLQIGDEQRLAAATLKRDARTQRACVVAEAAHAKGRSISSDPANQR